MDTLIAAARMFTWPVKIAGDGPEMHRLRASAPSNVEFLGQLGPERLSEVYAGSRIVVVPSRSQETFSLAAAEAMMHGKPVVASRIGALPELVEDGIRGRLVPVNRDRALGDALEALWHDDAACARFGAAALAWARDHYSEDVFYRALMSSYRRARSIADGRAGVEWLAHGDGVESP